MDVQDVIDRLVAHDMEPITLPNGGTLSVSVSPTDPRITADLDDYGRNTVAVRYDYPSGHHGQFYCRGFNAVSEHARMLADAIWELLAWLESAQGRIAHTIDEYHAMLSGGR